MNFIDNFIPNNSSWGSRQARPSRAQEACETIENRTLKDDFVQNQGVVTKCSADVRVHSTPFPGGPGVYSVKERTENLRHQAEFTSGLKLQGSWDKFGKPSCTILRPGREPVEIDGVEMALCKLQTLSPANGQPGSPKVLSIGSWSDMQQDIYADGSMKLHVRTPDGQDRYAVDVSANGNTQVFRPHYGWGGSLPFTTTPAGDVRFETVRNGVIQVHPFVTHDDLFPTSNA